MLADFEHTVRKLFVDGYIMVAPAQGVASHLPHRRRMEQPKPPDSPEADGVASPAATQEARQPERKTLTQIVFEQLDNMVELQYSTKSLVLWNGASRRECEASMQEIGQIVEDCLDRLRVDFGGNDLYMALEAMDITAWSGATGPRGTALRGKARTLCSALGVPYTWETWRETIRFVERLRRQSTEQQPLDSRRLWCMALAASRGGSQEKNVHTYAPLITFFASITDGTGSVERFLGTHAAFLNHHVGGPDHEMAAICVEVAREGPTSENEICAKESDRPEVLLLTEWSRRCCQLWASLHGRRFACYKQRKDKGRTKTRWRFAGSMKAVGVMQAEATKALLGMADADALAASRGEPPERMTLVGVERSKVMRHARKRDIAPPTKQLLRFRQTTAQRADAKRQVECWPGFGPKAPQMRRKSGAVTANMVGAPRNQNVPSKRRWGHKVRLGFAMAATGKRKAKDTPAPPAKRPSVAPQRKESKKLVPVSSATELYTNNNMESKSLMLWATAIALGKETYVLDDSSSHTKHLPAIENGAKLHFTQEFCRKHREMIKLFRRFIAHPGSKWAEVPITAPNCTVISGFQECQAFLRRARTLEPKAGVQASFVTATPKALQGQRVSRFGRPVPAATQGQKAVPMPRPRWGRGVR